VIEHTHGGRVIGHGCVESILHRGGDRDDRPIAELAAERGPRLPAIGAAINPNPFVPTYRVSGALGSMARLSRQPLIGDSAQSVGRPSPTNFQLAAPSVLLKTPLSRSKAYTISGARGSTISDAIAGVSTGSCACAQVAPASTDFSTAKAPSNAYTTFASDGATAITTRVSTPCRGCHECPWSVLLYECS
jgi:hypothetical protein